MTPYEFNKITKNVVQKVEPNMVSILRPHAQLLLRYARDNAGRKQADSTKLSARIGTSSFATARNAQQEIELRRQHVSHGLRFLGWQPFACMAERPACATRVSGSPPDLQPHGLATGSQSFQGPDPLFLHFRHNFWSIFSHQIWCKKLNQKSADPL